MPPAPALDRARTLLEKRQFSQSLAPLLEVWAETRSARIAAFLDRASARFTRERLPLGGTRQARHARWLELAATRDSADIPRLLAALANGTVADVVERLAVLATFPPDPRIAHGLTRLLDAVPDETISTPAAALVANLASDERRAFSIDEEVLVTAIATLLDGAGEELLAAVHADPADDARRAVYADWLLEQNDLHGELVHLQLANIESPRAGTLRRKLERKLVGSAIWKVTREREIRRGFLERVVIAKPQVRALAASSTAPEWLTVTDIQLECAIDPAWFGTPNLRNLRRLRGAKAPLVAWLRSGAPFELEVLGLDADGDDIVTLVQDPGRLASLFTLALEGTVAPIAELATSPLRLQRLEVVTMLSHIGRWLGAIASTTITELAITNDPQIYCLRELGGPWSIDIPLVDWSAALAGNLAAGLAGVDATITIARSDARYLTHVEEALAPLGGRVEYR